MNLSDARTALTENVQYDLSLKYGESPTSAQLTECVNWARRVLNRKVRPFDPRVPVTLQADNGFVNFDENGATDLLYLYTPTGGTCKLTFRSIETTATIGPATTAAQVQAALEASALIDAGDVSVSLIDPVARAYKLKWKGQYKNISVGALTVTSNSLTGGTATAAVQRAPAFGKRILRIGQGWLDDKRVRDEDGEYGLYSRTAFEARHPHWPTASSGSSRMMVVMGRQLLCWPFPSSSFVSSSSGKNWVSAAVLEDDLTDVLDDGTELPEPVHLHEVVCELAALLGSRAMANEDEAWNRLLAYNNSAKEEIEQQSRENRMALYPTSEYTSARRFHR